MTFGIIVGGRIGYTLFYMLVDAPQRADLFAHPYIIFEIWTGGMSFHGGFIGVALAVTLFARRNGIDLLMLADLIAPCEPIGHFFVRIANFVNGDEDKEARHPRALGASCSATPTSLPRPTTASSPGRELSRAHPEPRSTAGQGWRAW